MGFQVGVGGGGVSVEVIGVGVRGGGGVCILPTGELDFYSKYFRYNYHVIEIGLKSLTETLHSTIIAIW